MEQQRITISITNRDYIQWTFDKPCDISPIDSKLFDGDVIKSTGELIESPIRNMKQLAGILILEDGKTYGRTSNGKRLLYRCIPDNNKLPIFLVPYDMKLGFSKDVKNKYVLFKFDTWIGKHPNGTIIETIGDVTDLYCYYEYQVQRRELNESLTQFSNKTRKLFSGIDENLLITKIIDNSSYKIIDRLAANVITIDPIGCVDIDDGFSCEKNSQTGVTTMSIYIANVSVWMNEFDLWDDISRVSTIYLPNNRRTMLPPVLSDNLCSLLENTRRIALCMDIDVSPNGEVVGEPRFLNAAICVKTNHSYDSPKMMRDVQYKSAMEITQKMNPSVTDSHELIEYWMVFMNTASGKYLAERGTGIFRNVRVKEERTSSFENPNTQLFFNNWDNISSDYSTFGSETRHDALGVEWYAQITSPIRRLVDLLNQTALMKSIGISSVSADTFNSKWFIRMDELNHKMKQIRRVQNDCEIMRTCYNEPDQRDTGIIFDKVLIDGVYKYKVYLENLRVISSIKSQNAMELYSRHSFRIFLFVDESDRNRKIRLEIAR
jgi:exoribonuclease R